MNGPHCEDTIPATGACYTQRYSLDFEERRAQVRIPMNETGSIMVLRPSVIQVKGHNLDISKGAISLIVFRTLEPGTILQIRSQKRFVLAEVRNCVQHADTFRVGVEIKDVFKPPASELF